MGRPQEGSPSTRRCHTICFANPSIGSSPPCADCDGLSELLQPDGMFFRKIYDKPLETFRKPILTTDEIRRALTAMELVYQLPIKMIVTENYYLFRAVMHSSVLDPQLPGAKWQAACYAIHGAYKPPGNISTLVGDPQDILTFLHHQFNITTPAPRWRQRYNETVVDALSALTFSLTTPLSKLPSSSTRQSPHLFVVSATRFGIASRLSFATLPSFSFLSSVTGGSTPPIQSWGQTK